MRRLYAWLGNRDLEASRGGGRGEGPIASAVAAANCDEIVLLVDQKPADRDAYVAWLSKRTTTSIAIEPVSLSDPTSHRDIYRAAVQCLESREIDAPKGLRRVFHLSPGTPAMHAIWVILGLTRFPAELIQSSPESGVSTADVPFSIAAEFLSSDALRAADLARATQADEAAPQGARFGDILYRSGAMAAVVRQAKRVAPRALSVLIEGESGTGKELFARAIHNESPRAEGPMRIVNCGAIPSELIDSEFFGHKKGAFTGADSDRAGAFVAADGGTLFLDEIGELPLPAQVRLLRALQEGEITPVGSDKAKKVDVRVIAATNRSLIDEVREGRFREDLFYRLAVGILKLPPLREREGDLIMLSDALLERMNAELSDEPGFEKKQLSVAARTLIARHPWPGNVRELANTIRRAALFSDDAMISGKDFERALLPTRSMAQTDHPDLDRPIEEGFDLDRLLGDIETRYLAKALEKAGGQKAKASRLLGFANHQTFANRLRKHGLA